MKKIYPNLSLINELPTILQELGNKIAEIYTKQADLQKTYKDTFDLVTEADILSETMLTEFLTEHCPNDQIVGEEDVLASNSTTTLEDNWCWIIDPLDGTNNFASGIPIFCISVGLLYNGYPQYSWILDPLRQEMFTAVKGEGAYLNHKRIFACEATGTSTPIGVTSEALHWMSITDNMALLGKISTRLGRIRIIGAQALQLCYVACGRFRAGISYGTKIWDDAAGALVVEESGATYRIKFGLESLPFYHDQVQADTKPLRSLASCEDLSEELWAIFHSIV